MSSLGLSPPYLRDDARTGFAGSLAIALLYVAVYLKDWASSWMSNTMAAGILVAGLAVGFAALTVPRNDAPPLKNGSIPLMVVFVVVWMLTYAVTGSPNLSSYYLAIPCAFVIANTNPRFFLMLMLAHLALTLAIQAGEYSTGQYLFVYEDKEGMSLDENLFAGGLDVFRAKGMFQGPLSAVAFALWMAFLIRNSISSAALLFLCAFLASGRLGMLTSAGLLATRFLRSGKSMSMRKLLPLLAGLVVGAGLLFTYSSENRLFFISTALDLGNTQNESRFYFWLAALAYYLAYSPLELLLGKYGFIYEQEGGTESDFLRLLLDCGLLGFMIYASAIGSLLVAAIRRGDWEDLLVGIMIILLMNIFPFIQSLSSSLLFWVYVIATLNRKTNNSKPV